VLYENADVKTSAVCVFLKAGLVSIQLGTMKDMERDIGVVSVVAVILGYSTNFLRSWSELLVRIKQHPSCLLK
jgi:hypothetical protein